MGIASSAGVHRIGHAVRSAEIPHFGEMGKITRAPLTNIRAGQKREPSGFVL
jgi:hypothetical protein